MKKLLSLLAAALLMLCTLGAAAESPLVSAPVTLEDYKAHYVLLTNPESGHTVVWQESESEGRHVCIGLLDGAAPLVVLMVTDGYVDYVAVDVNLSLDSNGIYIFHSMAAMAATPLLMGQGMAQETATAQASADVYAYLLAYANDTLTDTKLWGCECMMSFSTTESGGHFSFFLDAPNPAAE